MFVLILSKRKQDYLMQCGIDPIDGFTDYYLNTKELRQALHTYNIRATGFNKNFFDTLGERGKSITLDFHIQQKDWGKSFLSANRKKQRLCGASPTTPYEILYHSASLRDKVFLTKKPPLVGGIVFMIDRTKFCEAAETRVKTVKYKECDCQAFVEACAKDAGYYFNARGTNDMWRNYMDFKGATAAFPLSVGDVVLKWREESDKLPDRYKGDGEGDFYHIGIVTSLFPTIRVCHSANSKDNGKVDKFNSQEELGKVWQYAGTLKNTAAADTTNPSLATAIGLIEEALSILKKL